MKFSEMIRGLASPIGAVVVPTLFSFVAWCVPGFGVLRKGFNHPLPLLSEGGIMVGLWYGMIIVCAFLGERLGRALAPSGRNARWTVGLDDAFTYRVISIIGAAGAGYAFIRAGSLVGFGEITKIVGEGQANQLKYALYEDYSVGPASLRYVVIFSAGLAIYRLLTGISRGIWEIANLMALCAVTLISSRLSLIASVFTASVLFIKNNPPVRIPWMRILLGGAALFGALSLLNMSRNKSFYENRFSGGFLASGVSEIVAYVGAPFQGGLAAGQYYGPIARGMESIVYTDIEAELGTNSAFLEVVEVCGTWSFFLMALTSFGAALIIGLLRHQWDNHFALVGCALLYAYAEVWRIYLFLQGIIIALLVIGFGVPLAVMLFKEAFASRRRVHGVLPAATGKNATRSGEEAAA